MTSTSLKIQGILIDPKLGDCDTQQALPEEFSCLCVSDQ
jgi:hypothetical protein